MDWTRPALLLALIGCSGKGDSADSGDSACTGGSPPAIVDLYCENTGIMTYTPTGEVVPTMTVWADIEDPDGDLTTYSAEIFYDDVIDGSVDTTSSFGTNDGVVEDAEACGVPALFLGTTVFLRGGQPLYETPYEWGIRVTDASGAVSALASVTCTTPDESGEGATQ